MFKFYKDMPGDQKGLFWSFVILASLGATILFAVVLILL